MWSGVVVHIPAMMIIVMYNRQMFNFLVDNRDVFLLLDGAGMNR